MIIPRCLWNVYREREHMRLILSPKEFKRFERKFNQYVAARLKEEELKLGKIEFSKVEQK